MTFYAKHSIRNAMDLAVVSIAVALSPGSKRDVCSEIRIALGAVGPVPLRAWRAEDLLRGQKLDPTIISRAAEIAAEDVRPITDFRASAEYPKGDGSGAHPARPGESLGGLVREGRKAMKHSIQVIVNGEVHELSVEPRKTLLELLREDLDLTGTKRGCDNGECGACTVLLDGQPVNACGVLAVEVDGKKVMTIEGLAEGSRLHPLQEAFIRQGAVQCGYCSPGMILTAKAFLDENPRPTEGEVRKAIAGNLCRCGAYNKIVKAVLSVAQGE